MKKKKKIIDCECGWVKPKHWQTIAPKVNIPCEKTRRRRQRGGDKTKALMSRTRAQHVRFQTLCIFLAFPLQNNNVKSPKYLSFYVEKIAVHRRDAEVKVWHRKRR